MNLIEQIEEGIERATSHVWLKNKLYEALAYMKLQDDMCEYYRLRCMLAEGGNNDGRKSESA